MENYDEFSHIQLNEEEIKAALYEARKEKDRKLREQAYWAKVRGPKTYQRTTAEELYNMVKLHPALIIDQDNEEVVKQLSLYFSCDPRMEQYGLDPKKGLILAGPPGCGKTTLMKLYANNMAHSFQIVSCRKVGYDFSEQGFKTIEVYSMNFKGAANIFGHTEYGFCFDDLGADDERKRFGDKVNVMAEIIMERYDKAPFKSTYLTTNLEVDQIEEVYGTRVRSRLREMCNFVTFDPLSPDRRK